MRFFDMRADFFTRIPLVFIWRVFYVADLTGMPSGYIELLFVFYGRSPPFLRDSFPALGWEYSQPIGRETTA
jgi:hypothetical protein